jgi:hypothetical protein
MIRPIALFALAATAILSIAATAAPAQAEGYCKAGHNFVEEKGLCYDPSAAYKPDVPKGETSSSSWVPSLSGLGGKAVLCNYGDRLVGSGDQAYCVSKNTNKPYPAGR